MDKLTLLILVVYQNIMQNLNPFCADTRGFFVHKVREIWNNFPPELHNISYELFSKKIKIYPIRNIESDKLHRDGRYVIVQYYTCK